jgi:hypothetical protein
MSSGGAAPAHLLAVLLLLLAWVLDVRVLVEVLALQHIVTKIPGEGEGRAGGGCSLLQAPPWRSWRRPLHPRPISAAPAYRVPAPLAPRGEFARHPRLLAGTSPRVPVPMGKIATLS